MPDKDQPTENNHKLAVGKELHCDENLTNA